MNFWNTGIGYFKQDGIYLYIFFLHFLNMKVTFLYM